MKKAISFLLVGIMLWFFTSSCMQQPVQFDTHPDTSIETEAAVLIVSAIAIAAVATIVTIARHKPVTLTPAGENVKLIMHTEAPENAEYLGDIQTNALNDLLSVKNDLRNHAARMGGNLLVVDTIQPEFFQGKNWGYSGSGRVYFLSIN